MEVKVEVKVEVKKEVGQAASSAHASFTAGRIPMTEAVAKRARSAIESASSWAADDAGATLPALRRPRRCPPQVKAKLTLAAFPPGTRVFTPRRGFQEGGSFCPVFKHDEGQLRVAVHGEPSALVSLAFLTKRQEQGLAIVEA